MIKIIRRNSSKIYVILCIIVIFFGCDKKIQKYYYAYYTINNCTPEYYIIKEIICNSERKEVDYIFSIDGNLRNRSGNTFKVTNNGLDKLAKSNGYRQFKPYLSVSDKCCVEFKYDDQSLNDFASSRFSYIGKEDLIIGEKIYKGCYKFRKGIGDINTVFSYVYYDMDYIPIFEEFIEGGRPYFKIQRIDTIPKVLKNEIIK
jgi:hypothetical protein